MSTGNAILPDARVNKDLQGSGARATIQRFGAFLAGMIMPNIGAFIAWGLITALFIETGWAPNATLAMMVDPMLKYLLPTLIGYTGGRMVHGTRGAVIGAIATMGVIVGSDVPMFIGAMLIGPLAAWLLKRLDRALEGHVPAGFEMLVDNFSLGILGMLLAIGGHLGIGPVVAALMGWMAAGVEWLIGHSLLPLVSILVEPAKVLFLNNAINHGILTPLGTQEVTTMGRSILFMVESNPGPGFGLLLAYWVAGSRKVQQSVPGAIIIHLFGGIHEIFFPYVLMKPKTILATIAGGMSGLFVGSLLGAGLLGPASPGSILSWFIMTPRNGYVPMIAMFLTATAVSFVVAWALIRGDQAQDNADEAAADAAAGEIYPDLAPAGVSTATPAEGARAARSGEDIDASGVSRIVVACDAGMGSSVMVASSLKKKLAPYAVDVVHSSVEEIPPDADLVLTQRGLVRRVANRVPRAQIVPFTNFVGDPAFDAVEEAVRRTHSAAAPGSRTVPSPSARPTRKRRTITAGILPRDAIRLGLHAADKEDAIRQAGQVLVDVGAADPAYIQGMLDREHQTSTYMDKGFTIPHGTNESREFIDHAALGFLQFPDGVDWDGRICHVAIPIASKSDEHVGIIAALARVLADDRTATELRTATTQDQVLELLAPEED